MIDPILLALLIFGAWISYGDIKEGKIKNHSILALILVAIFINTYFTSAFLDFPLPSLFNILAGIMMGVIVWIAGLWSAADAKLFIGLNFLFPVTFYQHYSGYFPGLTILFNSSIPLFFFLFFQVLIKTNLRQKKEALLSNLKPLQIIRSFLAVSAIFSLLFLIHYFLRMRWEYPLSLIFIFLTFWFIEQKLKVNLTYFYVFILLISLILFFYFQVPIFNINSLFSILIFSLLIFFLSVILTLATSLFSHPVKIDNLKEGMILAEMVVQEGKYYVKKPITSLTFLAFLRERAKWQPSYGFNPDGLTSEEIKELQSLARQGLLKFEELRISFLIPFAPILFLGAFLTYFARGLFINLFF